MLPTSLPAFSAVAHLYGLLGCALLGCISSGCATFGPSEPLAGAAIELTDTPFYPQTEFMCGPSALATVLYRTNVQVTPEQLAEHVYVPGRQGSLQLEMVAATRRYDRLAVQIDPALGAIVEELAAGRPVLVLQNLGVAWLPFWHYAVVVGYDPQAHSFVLRSGTTEKLTVHISRFARTWARSDNWAVVVLRPGELPSGRDPAAYIRAVAGLESVGRLEAALPAYESGLTRWPANEILLLGYGNALYGSGNKALAVAAYRELLVVDPNYLPALNNLANALGELGCREEALAAIAGTGVSIDGAFAEVLAETRQTIQARGPASCQLD